jgi:hypothetical protein
VLPAALSDVDASAGVGWAYDVVVKRKAGLYPTNGVQRHVIVKRAHGRAAVGNTINWNRKDRMRTTPLMRSFEAAALVLTFAGSSALASPILTGPLAPSPDAAVIANLTDMYLKASVGATKEPLQKASGQ